MSTQIQPESNDLAELSDIELIDLTRSGDGTAFSALWSRHYKAGVRAAISITGQHDPEDMVQEAFARILQAIHGNGGPKEVFRPYLYTVLRSVSMNWSRDRNDSSSLDELGVDQEPAYSFEGQFIEGSITAIAFSSLRPEWRTVLWYSEVEGMTPREMAPLLGLTANATAALAYRAREGLRASWLQAHLNSERAEKQCQGIVDKLGQYNRGTLGRRDRDSVQEHLTTCLKCSILVEEIDHLGRNLGLVLLPLFLGPAAASTFMLTPIPEISLQLATTQNSAPPIPRGRGKSIGIAATAAAVGSLILVAIALAAGQSSTPLSAAPMPSQSLSPSPSPVPTTSDIPQLPQVTPPRPADPDPGPGPDAVAVPPLAIVEPGVENLLPTPPSPTPTPTPTPSPTPEPEPQVLAAPAITAILEQGFFLPLLSGTGAPNAQVVIVVGTEQVAQTLVGADGTWSVTPELTPGADGTVRVSAFQTLAGLQSPQTPLSAPLILKTPEIISVSKDSNGTNVTFNGPSGQKVEAILDGRPTGNYHVLTGTPLTRTIGQLSPGVHTIALRFADPATGRHGATVTREIIQPDPADQPPARALLPTDPQPDM